MQAIVLLLLLEEAAEQRTGAGKRAWERLGLQ